MKKTGEERFEKELLQALRGPMRASERDAARTRVSRRLQASLSLEVGAASALPLLLEAPQVAASQAAVSIAGQANGLAAASGAIGGGAAGATGAGVAGAGVAAAATHPLGALLTAFALGAGAGGGTLVALSAGHVFESKVAPSSKAAVAPSSLGMHQRSRSVRPRPSGTALVAPGSEVAPTDAVVHAEPAPLARASSDPLPPAKGRPAPAKLTNTVEVEPQSDTLTVQQALLDRARAALAHGDGRQALAALSEHARTHPASELVEEREALTIKSLIASGDATTARARAVAFAARYPRSLFLPSIRAALPENP